MNTKGIKFLAVLAVLAMAFAAFAVLTDSQNNDADAVAWNGDFPTETDERFIVSGNTYKVKTDLNVSTDISIKGVKVIDLNGHTITTTEGIEISTAGANLTIQDTSAAANGKLKFTADDGLDRISIYGDLTGGAAKNVSMTLKSGTITNDKFATIVVYGKGAVLNVEGGVVENTYKNGDVDGNFAIAGNGTANYGGIEINISGGKIVSEQDCAIYLPNYGTTTITGGEIKGWAGIEIDSGKLSISGDSTQISSTYTGEGTRHYKPSGDGNYNFGTAVAVVTKQGQYNLNGKMNISITGGTLSSANYAAIDEYDLKHVQDPSVAVDSNVESLTITGGIFKAKIISDDCTDFVSGGAFSDLTALPYVKSDKSIDFIGNLPLVASASPDTVKLKTTVNIASGASIAVGDKTATPEYALVNNGIINVCKGGSLTGSSEIGGTGDITFDGSVPITPEKIPEGQTPAAIADEIADDIKDVEEAIIEFPAENTTVSDTQIVIGSKEVAFVGNNKSLTGINLSVGTATDEGGSVSFSGFSAVTGQVTTGTGTSAQTITLTNVTGSFTISKGSIIIDGTDYSGEVTIAGGAELKLSGTVKAAGFTVKYDTASTGAAKVIIEEGKGLEIKGLFTIDSDKIALQVDGKLFASGAGSISSKGNITVNDGGEIDSAIADAGKITITANFGSKVSGALSFATATSQLVAYSGSDINGITCAEAADLKQIVGKDAEGGKWSFGATAGELLLENYNGTYNFKAFGDAITSINLVGINTVSYTAPSTYAGATLFGAKVSKISTVQGSANLAINADLSAASGDSLANNFYAIHNDAGDLDINAVAVAIDVTGYNSDWTEIQIAAGQFEGICASGLKLYNADLDVKVMATYAAEGGIGVHIVGATDLEITSCEEIIILSSGTAVVVGDDFTVKDTIVVANGQLQGMTVNGNITVSNYAMVTVVNGLVAGNIDSPLELIEVVSISQESVLAVDDLNLYGALTNNGKVILTGDSIVQDGASITNMASFTNSGLIGVYGTLTNSTDGKFDNTGTVAVYQYKLPAAGALTLPDEDASTGLLKLKSVSIVPANMVLNADGIITVNDATLTFQDDNGDETADVTGFKGTLTYNQVDEGSYSLYLTNDGAAISITFDNTEADKKIGKAYSLTLSGDVTIGTTPYTLETNTNKTVDVGDTIKTAVGGTTGAFSVAGGTFDNDEGIVSLYKTATPIAAKGTFKGSYVTTVDTTMAGKMTGNIYSKGDVTVNGTLNGDVYSTGDVTIKSTSATSTAKVFGNVVMSNSKELKSFTLKGAMDGCLKYITEYNTVTSGTPVMQEFTATLNILGIEKYGEDDGMIIKATPGKDATSTTAATGGYFDLNRAAALAEDTSVKMALTEGKFAVSKSVSLPVAYELIIKDDTTIEVAKTATFTIDGGLMVADGAEKNYELVTIPVKYGKLSYVMMFDIAEGYTVFSNVEFALSNCDENSVLTVGQNATMTDSVSIKAGVEVIVNNVSINFGKYGLEMAEGAKITLVGTGNLVFGVTGDDGETEPTLYYISGTVVYDDNALIIKGVRFVNDEIASSTIVGTAATSTADSKFTVAFDYNCGAIALAEGNLAGTIDLDVFVDDEEEEATYASYFIAEGAVSEAFITDAFAAYGEDDKEEVRTLVDVDGTMKVSKALTILGAYAGPGEIILADGIAVDVKGSAVTGLITIGNGTDGINATSVDSAFTIKSVAATTSVPAYVLLSNAVLKKAALETEGNVVADGVLLDAEFDKEKESENYVASLIVSEDSTLTVVKHGDDPVVLAGGLLLVKGTLNYYTEDTKSYGKIYYQVNFESEGYTVYTVLKTATMVAPAGTTISIEDDLTYNNTSLVIPTGISIEIAEGHAITLENGAYIILGDADEMNALGAAGCLTGVIIVDDESFVIDYPNSGSMIVVYADEDKETLASEGIFLVQDVVYASVYGAKAFELEPVLDILVPVVPGYYFNAWYLQNGEKVEDDTKITAGPFVANVVASKVTVVFTAVAGINYYVDGELVNVLEAPVKYDYGATVTAKISDTSKYQGTPLVNGKAYILIDDEVSKIVGSGVNPIPVPPEPEPEPVIGDSGLSLTDILLIVLVILIAIMVVILVLRLNRS